MKKIFLTFLVSLFLISFISAAVSEPSVCCEKLENSDGNCINAPASECDSAFKTSPTSCESTSYCKLGTCYDSKEGICMDNTPQTTCEKNGGTWDERDSAEIPQCQLGCCVIADQAAFVPLVRCKRLSSLFGVTVDYRKNIFSEIQCIATAQSQDMGACVYEEDFENACKFTTRGDCNAQVEVEVANETEDIVTGKKFYKDYLCSAEELGTSCARQVSTTCYQGKVYWTDSCGNRENVYSSDEARSWNNGKVLADDSVCAPNNGDERDCGNCDYLLGARCSDVSGIFASRPAFGDLACKKTTCTDRWGDERINGESWCVHPAAETAKTDAVGSRYFKEVCVDGTVRVEACEDYRNEICIEGAIETSDGEFSSAACRVNRWQDCLFQTELKDCENVDKRDCIWKPNVQGMTLSAQASSLSSSSSSSNRFSGGTPGTFSNPTTGMASAPITGNAVSTDSSVVNYEGESGVCVPAFAPGFDFWQEGDSQAICSQASARCQVVYTKKLYGDWEVDSGEECLTEAWALDVNGICASVGDCGGSINYNGDYSDEGYNWIGTKTKSDNPKDVKRQEFSPSARVTIKNRMTGFATTPSYLINDEIKLNTEGYVYVKSA